MLNLIGMRVRSRKENGTKKRRTGGIVTAVTLAIAAAFIAIMLLFVQQGVTVAQEYAQSTTDLYASDLMSALSSFMREQDTLVVSGLLDEELIDVLEREPVINDRRETAGELSALLKRLVVDEEVAQTSVLSLGSHVMYMSDGTWMLAGAQSQFEFLIKEVQESGSLQSVNSFYVAREPGRDGDRGMVAFRRLLVRRDTPLGVLALNVATSSLAQVLTTVKADDGQTAVCFLEDGTVLFGTSGSVASGTDIYVAEPVIASLRDQLSKDPTQCWRVWTGLQTPFPRDQELYTVRYDEDFDAFLLTTNTADTIFTNMRMRTSTLVVALGVVMLLLMFLVITSVRWYRARLIQVATTDELTGLANRKSFVDSYAKLMEKGLGGAATLALIDVDRFKQINDGYGHAAGDRALAAVAREVRRTMGADGLAGRWGGDEFIGVLRAAGDDAHARIQDMIDRIAALEFDDGFAVSVSVGTTVVDVARHLEKVVEQADDALYVTKEGGRGFLTVYEPGVTPHVTGGGEVHEANRARSQERPQASDAKAYEAEPAVSGELASKRLLKLVVESLMEATTKMIPFVAGGGILIAMAFLIDGASVDLSTLDAQARASFGSITPIASGLRDVGSAAFNFMLPIFAAFFARGLAGDEAFMAGFAGGFLASQGSAGFAGAICAALVAALVVHLMKGFMEETPVGIRRIAPVLAYPVFSLLIMYLLMIVLIDPVASAFDAWLTSLLVRLESGNRVVLGLVCGAMMATDMGGPINKAAYHFGTAAIALGKPDIMAAVMVGGMVPPCGIALCMLLFRNRFTPTERDGGPATMVMGLSFITEGALPFVLTDLLRVIPACMLGAGVAGACSMAFGCTLVAPHGGVFVFPVVGNALWYVVALVVGSLITAVVLGLLKRPVEQDLPEL